MAKKTENQVIHLKTSSKYYCHKGFTGGPFTSACQNNLPKEVERQRVKTIKKMDFVAMVKAGDIANLCPACLEVINPTQLAEKKYVETKALYRNEKLSGSVTRLATGKISFSITGGKYVSGAARDEFRALGRKIVESDFKHPAIYSLTQQNFIGLIEKLRSETQLLKKLFIEKTINFANSSFAFSLKLSSQSQIEWLDRHDIKYEIKPSSYNPNILTPHIDYQDKSNRKKITEMENEKSKVRDRIKLGLEGYIAKEVKYAEAHYEHSLEKLSARLNEKGIKDDTDFEITSGQIKENFEITIKHGDIFTKAWTIIAEGLIQRPHYRYLVK